jgi:hypothetical protein
MNEKYKNLDDDQKNILREYINNISNTNDLNEIVLGEFIKLKNKLTEVKDKIDNDIVKIKINETVNQLDKVKLSKGVKDNHIMAILLGYELLKEVKNKIV